MSKQERGEFFTCGNCLGFSTCRSGDNPVEPGDDIAGCEDFSPKNGRRFNIEPREGYGKIPLLIRAIDSKSVEWWCDSPLGTPHTPKSKLPADFWKDGQQRKEMARQIARAGPEGADAGYILPQIEAMCRDIGEQGGVPTAPLVDEGEEDEYKSQRDALIELARGQCSLFHDEHQVPFVMIALPEGDGVATLPLRGRDFKNWLSYRLYQAEGCAPNNEALNSALNTLGAIAIFEGERRSLAVRVAKDVDGSIVYDLGGPGWSMVKITPGGWQVVPHKEPIFRRYSHMAQQEIKIGDDTGGDFKRMVRYANLKNFNDELLLLCTVAAYLVPEIPHPILVTHGEPGSGKTTLLKMVRSVVDPSSLMLNSPATEKREAVQTLAHNYVCALDNVGTIKTWQSDLLCRAVTGEGFSKRELYTDDGDIIYTFRRCVILNDITIPLRKADVLDRAVLLELQPLDVDERKAEDTLWAAFEKDRPAIFQGLLNTLAKAMALMPDVRKELTKLPRMADFCLWGEAIARALGYPPMAFYQQYMTHVQDKEKLAVEENIVGELMLVFMKNRDAWSGTPTELYTELEQLADRKNLIRQFPKSPNAFSRKLTPIMGNLRRMGIIVERTHNGTQRFYDIKTAEMAEGTQNTVSTVNTVITSYENPNDGENDGVKQETNTVNSNGANDKKNYIVRKIPSRTNDTNDTNDIVESSSKIQKTLQQKVEAVKQAIRGNGNQAEMKKVVEKVRETTGMPEGDIHYILDRLLEDGTIFRMEKPGKEAVYLKLGGE